MRIAKQDSVLSFGAMAGRRISFRIAGVLTVCFVATTSILYLITYKDATVVSSPTFMRDTKLVSASGPNIVAQAARTVSLEALHHRNQRRLDTMARFCGDPGSRRSRDRHGAPSCLVVDYRRVIYCPLPKAGTSYWHGFLIRNNGRPVKLPEHYSVHDPSILKRNNVKRLDTYAVAERQLRLRNYFKFLVVRHPFDRLVSAHNDKTYHDDDYKPWLRLLILHRYRFNQTGRKEAYFKRLFDAVPFKDRNRRTLANALLLHREYENATAATGKQVIKKAAMFPFGATDLSLLEEAVARRVTFPEFVAYMVARNQPASDQHWIPAFQKCDPCYMNYTYIVKIETLGQDFPAIQSAINVTSWYDGDMRKLRNSTPEALGGSPDPEEPQCVTGRVLGAFRDIPAAHVKSLLKMYSSDMNAFGYTWDQDTLVAGCLSGADGGSHCC